MKDDTTVERAVARMREILGPAWDPIADRVTHQIAVQSSIAAKARVDPSLTRKPEYRAIRDRNVQALTNNINFHQPISLDLARRAALAAWSALEGAAEGTSRA